jgi:hypothetical protein
MSSDCLTALAPIKPGQVDALRAVLRPIGDDINGTHMPAGGRPHIDFTRSGSIHFARFAILTDPDLGPDRYRLLYASVYDGSLEAHAAELAALTSDLDAIWGHVEGYPGRAGFASFLAAHANQPAAYYIAFRDESASSIKRAIAAREATEAALDGKASQAGLSGPGVGSSVVAGLRRFVRAAPIVVDIVSALARFGFADVFRGALRILASLDRYPFFRLVNSLTRNQLPPRRSPFSSVAVDGCEPPAPLVPGDEIPSGLNPAFREDVVSQNQLTLVTVIADGQANRVRAVMSAIDSYAKRLAPPGSLIGISTIHFVRWLVIDNGRRLMMVSDYDGSWESYIDEFAEMILSGLDAIWETARAFPPDGARDLPAFKRFLRNHQVPAEVFFSAYPAATTVNVLNDTRIRDARGSTSIAGMADVGTSHQRRAK